MSKVQNQYSSICNNNHISHKRGKPASYKWGSIGVAIYPDTMSDINLIVEKADLALYEAKRAGRNRVILGKNPLGLMTWKFSAKVSCKGIMNKIW